MGHSDKQCRPLGPDNFEKPPPKKLSIASYPWKKTEGERHGGEPLLISFRSLLSPVLDKLNVCMVNVAVSVRNGTILLLQPLKVMMFA
ncbi:hypothetical protein NC652_038218 [Populus alba x Populus x berolinensis]|nr:hypothetical protein NC652_038218 [Populus alba x Populus x berolinensis]